MKVTKLGDNGVSIEVPKIIGQWALPCNSVRFAVVGKKPSWFRRKMMQVVLGIVWVDL